MTSLLSIAAPVTAQAPAPDPTVSAPAADVAAAVDAQARGARRVLTHHALYGVTLR